MPTFNLPLPVLIAFACLVLYLAGEYIPPIGRLIAFLFLVIGVPVAMIEKLFSPFKPKQKSDVQYPGLRTIMLIISLILALAATLAEVGGSLQGLQALKFEAPALPSIVNSAIGVLFIAVSCLFGALLLEAKEAVPQEAKLFSLLDAYKDSFKSFTKKIFYLSVVASVSFYAARAAYIANADAPLTHYLQDITLVLIGLLVPFTGAIALFIVAAGIHAVLSLLLMRVWGFFSLLTELCVLCFHHFNNEGKKKGKGVKNLPPRFRLEEETPANAPPSIVASPGEREYLPPQIAQQQWGNPDYSQPSTQWPVQLPEPDIAKHPTRPDLPALVVPVEEAGMNNGNGKKKVTE